MRNAESTIAYIYNCGILPICFSNDKKNQFPLNSPFFSEILSHREYIIIFLYGPVLHYNHKLIIFSSETHHVYR